MSCYLCGGKDYSTRPGEVRDNPKLQICECSFCGLVYLSSQSHINEGHYENSGMHGGDVPDIDAWLRETQEDDQRRYQFIKDKCTNKSVLDFGCGVGGFLDRIKTVASTSAGIELETALQASFKQRGLQVFPNLEAARNSGQKWDLITAFHVLEHLPDPAQIIKELSSLLEAGGEMIIEVPSSDDVLLTLYENQGFQKFTYWSQHLFLFNSKTMRTLIDKAGLKCNWLKHVQRYPLSNHLCWLAKGKAGGHKKWNFMNSQALNEQYEQQLAALGLTDTIIASVSK